MGPGRLSPKPCFHLGAENDPLVKFAWQERMVEVVRRVNGVSATPKTWAERCQWYASTSGTPVVTWVHQGKHDFPAEAPALIVRFFKEFGAP